MRLLTAGSLVRVQLGEPRIRSTRMCAPYFFLFIDSNQRQAAPNLFANLAETVRWTVSQQVAQPWCAAVKCPFGVCVCVLRIFFFLLTRTTTSCSKFALLQIWEKQSGGLFRSRLRNLEIQPKRHTALCAPFFLFF